MPNPFGSLDGLLQIPLEKKAMACHFPTYKIHHVVRGFPSLPHVDDNGGRAMDMNMNGCEYGYERAA